MAKSAKKTQHHKAARRKLRNGLRNAAPTPQGGGGRRASSAGGSRSEDRSAPTKDSSTLRMVKTIGGAMGAALACAYIARENWIPPKFVTGLVGAVGATLAVFSHTDTLQSVGNGVMSAAGAQLGLMTIDDHYREVVAPAQKPVLAVAGKKVSNNESLPPGALESAYERARARLAMANAAGQMAA